MQDRTEARGDAGLQRIADLLGGTRVLRHTVRDSFDAHEMLLEGILGAALVHLVGHLANLPKSASFEKAVGMSLRTIQRRRDTPGKRLSQEQSGRTWKFAEVLAKATAVLGTQENAEHWHTIQEAECAGMLRYLDNGILFTGRDESKAIRSASIRHIKPVQLEDGKVLTKRDFADSDKNFPAILPGSLARIVVVEGGVNALAVRDIAIRAGQEPPTVITTGGVGVRKWVTDNLAGR